MGRKLKTPKWLLAAKAAKKSPTPRDKPSWLSRALSKAGIFPLQEAEQAIAQGRVCVNSRVVKEPFAPLSPDAAVTVDGQRVELNFSTRVLMFHKPAGVVTAPTDPENQGTVFDKLSKVLPERLQRFGWHAIGRLDRNTTGLLLFTNDEKLVAHVTHPSTHLPKRYVAKVLGKVTEEKLQPLREGMTLNDGPTLPAKAEKLEKGVVALTLTEGKNHQVKRMLGAMGLPVTHLHRESVGQLKLDVPEGEFRELTEQEVRECLGFGSP